MNLEIVIPNFKGSQLIRENLPKLLSAIEDYKNIKITIVDDGSGEGELNRIYNIVDALTNKNTFNINVMGNKFNKGFSSSINKAAFKSDSDILIFLNTDVIPLNNFIDPIIKDFKENKNLFGIGFMDKTEDGDKIIMRGRGLAKWRRGLLIHERGDTESSNTFWVSGGSSAIRTDVFKKIGGYDEIYNPFYWEDIDLSYRAQKSGLEILFENKSIVLHDHKEGAISNNYNKNKINKIAYRNQFIFIWKNITDWNLICSHLFWLPFHLAKALMRLDTSFICGFILALVKIPVIIKKRADQKRYFVVGDEEILAKFSK